MQNVAIKFPIETEGSAVDTIDLAVEFLGAGSVEAALAAAGIVAAAAENGVLDVADERIENIAIELAVTTLGAFDEDFQSAEALAIVARMPAAVAAIAVDCVLMANFEDGVGDHAELPDATLLCLAALTDKAGGTGEALAMLRDASEQRAAAFEAAAYAMRCRMLGIDAGITGLWLVDAPRSDAGSIETLREIAMETRALDPEAHRALGRALAEAGDYENAIAALMTGLALPIGDGDKIAIGADMLSMAILLRSIGQSPLLDAVRVQLALDAAPRAIAYARALGRELDTKSAFAAIHPDALADARGFFARFERPKPSPYPTVNGRPHVDIVWLEITNFCNQKCTFCPDMFREDSRQWLPLDRIKALIDEMHATLSVGSMQLNAYGEPLLHPNIAEILAYIREKELPFPTFFTSHGMTLVEKKLKQLSHNYPAGIAISLHNDSQESYEATRSAKIGDYDTLVARVTALISQMVNEQAESHIRLYQMVSNGQEDQEVDAKTRGAFPDTLERMAKHVRKWEAIAAEIAANAPPGVVAQGVVNSMEAIEAAFVDCLHGEGQSLPVLWWLDAKGQLQHAFITARPVSTYGNLLLEYDARWEVERKVVNPRSCGFARSPSLAIFATGKLGICCMDMNSTATFASLDDHPTLVDALQSDGARQIFAQISNGIATSRGCQICLGTGVKQC